MKVYQIKFKGYLYIDAKNNEDAYEKAAEVLYETCGANHEITDIEELEDDDYDPYE